MCSLLVLLEGEVNNMVVFNPEALCAPVPGHFQIVDSHVHPTVSPWLAGAPAFLRRTVTGQDLFDALGAAGVGFATLVEVGQNSAIERGYFLGFANALTPVRCIVMSVDLLMEPDKLRDELRMLISASGEKFRGVRILIQDREDAIDFMRSTDLRRGLQVLAEFNLCFDICIRSYKPGQMAGALDLVRASPMTRFIIDHLGKPKITGTTVDADYLAWLRAMAAEKNTFVKISALVDEVVPELFEQGPAAWKPAVWAHIDAGIAAFSFSRSMWGGDWPVSSGRLSYAENLAVYATWAEERNVQVQQREMLFSASVQHAYGFTLPNLEA